LIFCGGHQLRGVITALSYIEKTIEANMEYFNQTARS